MPLLLTLSVAKLATPLTAATVVVPASAAPLVPVPGVIATVTVPVKLGTVFPAASCASTCTGGVSVAPAVALLGCVVKTSRVAAPGVMSKGALVAPVSAGWNGAAAVRV